MTGEQETRVKLRLLVFRNCNRNCPCCCNKDYDLDNLPVETDFRHYYEISLTGGEPMLKPDMIIETCRHIREQNTATPIFLYTAWITREIGRVLPYLQGITITFHVQSDVGRFLRMKPLLERYPLLSRRLNIFDGIVTDDIDLNKWEVKRGLIWRKSCPLPEGEVFKKVR